MGDNRDNNRRDGSYGRNHGADRGSGYYRSGAANYGGSGRSGTTNRSGINGSSNRNGSHNSSGQANRNVSYNNSDRANRSVGYNNGDQNRGSAANRNGSYHRSSAANRSNGYNRNTSHSLAGKPYGRSAGRPAYSGYDSETLKKRITGVMLLLTLIAAVSLMFYGACAMCRQCTESCADKDGGQDTGAQTGGYAGSYADGGASSSDFYADGNGQQPVPQPESVDPVIEKAGQLLSEMTNEEKIGSLLLVRGDEMTFSDFERLVSDTHAGGAVLFRSDFDGKDRASVINMTQALQNAGGGHMLLCVDEEGGDVIRISSNALLRENRFRSPQRLYKSGGMDAIRDDTAEKCAFLAELGINVNFAPVADVVTDSGGFLYKRAFGQDAEHTAEYVGTVVGVMRDKGMGSCVKHFPGYGNAHGDTHEGLVTSAVTKDSLYSSDLVPFRKGIESGADSVMVTHTIVSCIDPDRPCSLSPAAVDLLRNELGFDGVVITDGLDMGAIQKYCGGDDPCVAAFLAGCDLMCTPERPYDSYNRLLEAVRDGTITAERLDASVTRILMWKIRLGLYD